MALRTHQPDTPLRERSRRGRSGRQFIVDRYELGFDIPLAQRFATVDLTRDGDAVQADVHDEEYRWTARLVNGEIVKQWRKELSGGARESLVKLPRWVHVVLDYVGVRT